MMLPKDTKLLRLVSARLDMGFSMEAYRALCEQPPQSPLRYHLALAMAVCYGRPFSENKGLGNLLVDYPSFPDFVDPDMNLRHHRLIDLRNNFMAHSSCEGTKLFILPPGSQLPDGGTCKNFDHLVGKRVFKDIRFFDWVKDVVYELKGRLDVDVRRRLAEIGSGLSAPQEMDTGYESFSWAVSNEL
jgi:hypothetical protein